MVPSQVGGVVLAAGGGRRFGGAKALVRVERQSLASRGVFLLAEAACAPIVLVIGAEADRVRREGDLPRGETVEVVENPDWADGIGSSLHVGLTALGGRCRAAVVALADQPLVSSRAVDRLVRAWEAGASAAVATFGGELRNPVLLDAALWPDVLASATGDHGAGPWLRANPSLVTPVPCDDVARPDDIDTPEDLRAITTSLSRRT
jgi:nicotine blue oxidoreductase